MSDPNMQPAGPNQVLATILPKWLIVVLGSLLVIFVAMLIVQKGSDIKNTVVNKQPQNTLSVSAEGKVRAVPDLATVTVGVMSQGTSAKEVKDQNNEKINKIVDFIKKQGIKDEDITTSQFTFYPEQDWSKGTGVITGYRSDQAITVKVHGIDKTQEVLEKIMDGVVNNGANQIQGVYFSFNDPDNLRQEARKLAITKAKAKAQELADEAGLKLGKVVSVSESGTSGYPMPIYGADYAMGMGGAEVKSIAPTVEPGIQDVAETMTVIFEVK